MNDGGSQDSWRPLNSLTDAAGRFGNHTPRLKRLGGTPSVARCHPGGSTAPVGQTMAGQYGFLLGGPA
jgi:hypothetical protein